MKKNRIFWGIVIISIIMWFHGSMSVEASDKYISSYDAGKDMSVKTENAIFTLKLSKDGNGSGSYDIEIKKGETSKVIVSNICSDFVTNGRIIYYTKHTKPIDGYSWKNTIYCYDIKSGKKIKIISGTDYCVVGCSGKYLYFGTELDYGIAGIRLYALNMKTKKKKHLVDYAAKNIAVSNGKILVSPFSGELCNNAIYIFNNDGSGKKRIDNGCSGTIKNGKIYYYKLNVKNNKYRLFKCSLTGKNKKTVTGWTDEVPEMFRTWEE